MKISKSFASKYLKADEIGEGRKVRCKILKAVMEEVGDDKETKPVLYFHGKDKGMVLNKTNAGRLAATYGDETDDWEGKELFIYVEQVSYQGKLQPGLRVETPRVVVEDEEEPAF